MKHTAPIAVFGTFALLAMLGTGGAAKASDFAQTTAAQQFSLAHGLGQTTLSSEQRLASGTAAGVSGVLLSALCGTSCARQSIGASEGGLRSTGNGWTLNVSADGSAARFENVAVQRLATALAKDPAQRMPAATLEAAGRAAIASKLRSAIVLGPQEELVAVRTDYLIAGLENLKSRTIVHSVIANRIVFGRRLHGVPVVGGGSTVVVTFANNGALESLRYDWPRYAPTAEQTIANVAQIVGRVNTVIAARPSTGGVPRDAKHTSVKARADAHLGGASLALQKLECGYFDPGVAARTGGLVQPGCVYHVVERDRSGFRQGFAGAVPAGVAFKPDAGWAETSILRARP